MRRLLAILFIFCLMIFLSCGNDCNTAATDNSDSANGDTVVTPPTVNPEVIIGRIAGIGVGAGGDGIITATASLRGCTEATCDLSVYFRGGDVGDIWTIAAVSGILTGLNDQTAIVFLWQSAVDQPDISSGDYQLKVVATGPSKEQGYAVSSYFTVNNGEDLAPEVIISSPDPGTGFRPDQEITFSGYAVDAEDGALPSSKLTWYLDDSASPLGTGAEVTVAAGLAEGLHTMTLTAKDHEPQIGKTALNFMVHSGNWPPETTVLTGPPTFFEGNHNVSFTWKGVDGDGQVMFYRYRLEGPINTNGWVETTDTVMPAMCIKKTGDYIFSVTAVDNEGEEDPTPAVFNFSTKACGG